jgi:hypothetical protein
MGLDNGHRTFFFGGEHAYLMVALDFRTFSWFPLKTVLTYSFLSIRME